MIIFYCQKSPIQETVAMVLEDTTDFRLISVSIL